MQSFHLISKLLEHNQSFDDIWSRRTVPWLTSSNTAEALLLIHVHQGLWWRVRSLSLAAVSSLPRVPLGTEGSVSVSSLGSVSTSSPPAPAARVRPGHGAGSAELAETESKLFNDNDDLDKHNKNDSSALEDSSKNYSSKS